MDGVTVAVSVAVFPFVRLSDVLERVIPVAGVVTVTEQVAFLLPAVAVIVALPFPTAVTTPLETVATDVLLDVHTTLSVELDGVTVAVSVAVFPFVRLSDVLERVIPVAGTDTTGVYFSAARSG